MPNARIDALNADQLAVDYRVAQKTGKPLKPKGLRGFTGKAGEGNRTPIISLEGYDRCLSSKALEQFEKTLTPILPQSITGRLSNAPTTFPGLGPH
jgi:hypothetical protein